MSKKETFFSVIGHRTQPHLSVLISKWTGPKNEIISDVQSLKKKFLVFTLGKFLEALGGRIGTGLVFCHSFSVSNNVAIHYM